MFIDSTQLNDGRKQTNTIGAYIHAAQKVLFMFILFSVNQTFDTNFPFVFHEVIRFSHCLGRLRITGYK